MYLAGQWKEFVCLLIPKRIPSILRPIRPISYDDNRRSCLYYGQLNQRLQSMRVFSPSYSSFSSAALAMFSFSGASGRGWVTHQKWSLHRQSMCALHTHIHTQTQAAFHALWQQFDCRYVSAVSVVVCTSSSISACMHLVLFIIRFYSF